MPAPTTADTFLELVRKSSVVADSRLNSFLAKSQTDVAPAQLAKSMIEEGVLTNFQAEQLLLGKWKRFHIGKYKVLEKIGSGGMGQVFLCEHKLMRRRVAVKVLPVNQAKNSSALDRFYREARAVAAVDHPNIVRAYDIDEADNLHFLVMEFVDGTNLYELVRKFGPLDITRACHYIYGTCVGLQHANEMGLIHRDIKPGNILIDRNGIVKLLDLGLARFFNDEEDQLTKQYDENVLGTADYLAPEQALDSHTVDIRADIYSLGGTFYFLLTGQAPFPEGSIAQKLLWHQNRQPAPIQTLRPEVPDALVKIIGKMMAKSPDDRYQRPTEVMHALQAWVMTPISPPPEHELPRLSLAATPASSTTMNIRNASLGKPMVSSSSGSSTLNARHPLTTSTPSNKPDASLESQATQIFQNQPTVDDFSPTDEVPLPEEHHWESMLGTPSTGSKTAINTKPPADEEVRERSSMRYRSPRNAPLATKKRLWILGAALGAVLLIGAGVLGYFVFRSSPTPTPMTNGDVWYVSKGDSPNPERTVATLRSAIDQAKPGETIRILDAEIEEPPILITGRGAGGKRSITIEAGPSGQVLWTPRSPRGGTDSALTLQETSGIVVRGLRINLENRVQNGIILEGSNPGITLESIHIENATTAGCLLRMTAGSSNPITISNCTLNSSTDAVGIKCAGTALNLLIEKCTMTGGRAGIMLTDEAGSPINVSNATIRDCHIADAKVGILLTGKADQNKPLDVIITNNSFTNIAAVGILVDTDTFSNQHLTVERNYFSKTKLVIDAKQKPLPILSAKQNLIDADSKEGPISLKAAVTSGTLKVDGQAVGARE